MIKRRFYRFEHGDRDAPSDSSSSDSEGEAEAEAEATDGTEDEVEEDNEVGEVGEKDNVLSSSGICGLVVKFLWDFFPKQTHQHVLVLELQMS